ETTVVLQAGQLGGGKYRLLRSIGEGGMASVWAARHEMLGRDVALKLAPVFGDPVQTQRFLREAAIIGRFEHPNIVNVVDAGELAEEGYLFLAMELLRGAPMSDLLEPGRALPPAQVLPILVGVCRGLEVAHEAGVVHRDVKPENVFLAELTGRVVPKLVDFGISLAQGTGGAKITIDGQILGTPAYMSPEQADGKGEVGPAADLWAVGVVLYEALAGRQPFVASNYHALLRRILEEEPAPLPDSVPLELAAIVARCLAKDPQGRYSDARALREDLEAAMAELGDGAAVCGDIGFDVAAVAARRGDRRAASTLDELDVAQDDPASARLTAAPPQRSAFTASFRSTRARLGALGAVACAIMALGAAHAPARVAPAEHVAIDPAALAGVVSAPIAPNDAPRAEACAMAAPHVRPVEQDAAPRDAERAHAQTRHRRPATRITSPGF
ncbi:MAG TPA: protein kinase, partial [Minicystis sp.]|nr:protein kinase [Minicystis sp.]